MGRPVKDVAAIYQRLADGWCLKQIADEHGIQVDSLRSRLARHRKSIKARSQENALAKLIARGDVIARE